MELIAVSVFLRNEYFHTTTHKYKGKLKVQKEKVAVPKLLLNEEIVCNCLAKNNLMPLL